MPQITLPTLHPGQVAAFMLPARFKVLRCGRRWGKTDYAVTVGSDGCAKREPIGIFAPDRKIMAETYQRMRDILDPIVVRASWQNGIIRTRGGGIVDFWSLENDRAGRSRKYKHVLIDEAAFAKPNAIDIWEQSIRPTLVDLRGRATVLSNTNGADPDNFLFKLCNDPKYGFREYHAPSWDNPHLPRSEMVIAKARTDPRVYRQEYGAEFVDWSGEQFFDEAKLLERGIAPPWPAHCDAVFAVIDTAMKDGKEHDGTAVAYWAISRFAGHPLVLLDWDVVQIQGAFLIDWLPGVLARAEELARRCGARQGSLGAWVEDRGSGTILIQHGQAKGLDVRPIEGGLTEAGKDARALSVSGYVYRGEVKFSGPAYDKQIEFKGASRNHMLSQVLRFRVGDKDAATRADDLLDCFTYGIAIALGNSEGF